MIILKVLIFAGFLYRTAEVVSLFYNLDLTKDVFGDIEHYLGVYSIVLLITLFSVLLYNNHFNATIGCLSVIFSYMLWCLVEYYLYTNARAILDNLNIATLIASFFYVVNMPKVSNIGETIKYFVTDTIYFFLHLF
jgi:hypothetical protein